MATDKVQTGLRLRQAALDKITAIAKREHRSLNAQLEHIVQRYVDEYERAYGEVISHADKE